MAVKKSALYSKLWDSCNTLRSKGGMDATQYKDYVLIILFMKVITDKYYNKKNSIIEVPDDANFNTMIEYKNKTNIGEKFNEILKKIAEENDLQNIIDVVDFNDETKLGKGKDKIEALTGLVEIFQDPDLDFSNNRADDDDILGDAYEYLMKQFASEAGKSKGQFYTPSEVSRVMSKIIGINKVTSGNIYVYDMACGSGSLLLKAGAEAPENVKVNLYGQEKDNSTAGLAVMNMFLHGNPTAVIKSDNTLTKPQFIENERIKTFDFCVANPPFSVKKWSSGMEKQYNRFSLGMPPDSCADYAFLLHMLTSMDPDHGRGAIILPHGVLFRGGQEALIREKLIKSGYVEGIIGLPSNLFYGTGIAACIIILDKAFAYNRDKIFMIDASKNYVKDGNKNKLREEDIKKITEYYLGRSEEIGFSKNVSLDDIKLQEYNLNLSRYIDNINANPIQDVNAHLNGGIPSYNIKLLNKYWKVAPSLYSNIFTEDDDSNYLDLKVNKNDINEIIDNSTELKIYYLTMIDKVKKWEEESYKKMTLIDDKTRVKDLIEDISDHILNLFDDDPLIDKYDAYEIIMNYYNNIMKDDMLLISENGWIPTLTYAVDKKGVIKPNEYESDLLPKRIIVKKYYSELQNKNDVLESEINKASCSYEELINENVGDDCLFSDDDKINDKFLKDKIKNEDDIDNKNILNKILGLLNDQKELRKQSKKVSEEIDKNIKNKYKELNSEESMNLVIIDKWFNDIENEFINAFDSIKSKLSYCVMFEVENYDQTLSELINKTSEYEKIVLDELKEMGFDV